MGSLLSPILADNVLQDLEDGTIDKDDRQTFLNVFTVLDNGRILFDLYKKT